MQFKHPEILYALLLLLIPIIIHLFQLRRFQKVDFTNVAFLKKATLQTRKSSQIKKWLTLLARLLALGCIILAFAQPFTATKSALKTEKEIVIYLDNSFSMQAKGSEGPLFNRTLQQLYNELNGEEQISWFTNDFSKKDVTQNDFKNEVLGLTFSQNQLDYTSVLLKAQQLFSSSTSAQKRFIWISDFQQAGIPPEISEDIIVDLVKVKPVATNNMAIDTAYIVDKTSNTLQLGVRVSGNGDLPENAAISLYRHHQLIAKTGVDFSRGTENTLYFDLENPSDFDGELRINDAQLQYDNTLFFSINKAEKIKVLAINEGNGEFLRKLFNNEHYFFMEQSFNSLNYNDIPAQNFIVVNELHNIPTSLTNALNAFQKAGGGVFVIPSVNADIESYNTLLNALQLGSLDPIPVNVAKKITKINFSHPLYNNVFEKEVDNFQYPTVSQYYNVNANASSVLELEDGRPFLLQSGSVYLATAAFDGGNSNFKNSPLIVPTMINMVQQSLPLPKLYYALDNPNTFAVPIKLNQDQILTLKDSTEVIIPLQQTKANSVEITTTDDITHAANYEVLLANQSLQWVSFNYTRNESKLSYTDMAEWKGVTIHESVQELFNSIAEANEMNSLWKWFVIFAVLFLLFEMFILKFL
jgi:Aerotolerance regulator N-terminal